MFCLVKIIFPTQGHISWPDRRSLPMIIILPRRYMYPKAIDISEHMSQAVYCGGYV